MRLRRSDPSGPGFHRRRRGRGFSYHHPDGRPVTEPEELDRFRSLVIPPAWRDVWISPHPRGHIQATGTDAAGRRQYLYHPAWRSKRDADKFAHVIEVARRLPALRDQVDVDLHRRGFGRERVLAAVAKLLDSGSLRIGGDEYAVGDDATYGVATLRPEHVRTRRGRLVFEFPAKGGVEQTLQIDDDDVCTLLRGLRTRRRDADRLFGYRAGEDWRDVRSDEINDYLRQASGGDMTAKDFRTWHATVRAAVGLADAGPQRSLTGRRRAVAAVMRDVAELLGNTPTVARTSYVDPRVVDRFHDGVLLSAAPAAPRPVLEDAVIDLLT